jgi:hypothetical protein
MNILAKLTDLVDTHPSLQEDFNRRYAETYMLYQETPDSPEIVVYCENTRGASILLYEKKERQIVVDGKKEDILLKPYLPKVGYYNTPEGPIYLFKAPRKQYRRSFCNGIYSITSPSTNGPPLNRVDWSRAADTIYKGEYVHLDDITNKLFANIAINQDFVVTANRKDIATVLYKRYEIAQLDFNSRTMLIIQPKLAQEIMDYFKYNGVQTWKLK